MKIRCGDQLYHVERCGKGPALLLLHGFTGSGSAFGAVREHLLQHFQVITVDALGHGQSSSPKDPARYALPLAAQDLLHVLDQLEVDDLALLGYSMGGRLALHLALKLVGMTRLRAVVLESASPGLASEKERVLRRTSDEALADLLLNQGIEAFADHWQALPLFISQRSRLPPDVRRAIRERRLKQSPIGLACSLRGAGTGSQANLWPVLCTLSLPLLGIAGAEDAKYSEIMARLVASVPGAKLCVVQNAGHTVHLEQPQAYIAAVLSFLAPYHDTKRWVSH